jgi:hypothetical protein
MPTCETCHQPITDQGSRSRFHWGACFRAHEAKNASLARSKWSPERRLAATLTVNAIRSGRLVRRPCEICGDTQYVDAHHDDYSQPLAVRWLCRSHHVQHHRAERARQSA